MLNGSAQVFLNFAVQQASIFREPRPRSVLQLGLGAGTATMFLREGGAKVDVVEINRAVVEVAASHLGYDARATSRGQTHVEDAHGFVMDGRAPGPEGRYDIVLHDVFVGVNPWRLMSVEFFAAIKEKWLVAGGALVFNFVGFQHAGTKQNNTAGHLLTAGVLTTLQAVFPAVQPIAQSLGQLSATCPLVVAV